MTTTINIGVVLDQYREVLDQLADLSRQENDLKKLRADLERAIAEHAEAAGLDSFSNDQISVTVKDMPVAKIDDWDAFWEWCMATGNKQVMYRQASNPKLFDLFAAGNEMPSCVSFETVRKVNHRRK